MGASGGKASSKLPLSLQIRSKTSGLKAKYMFSNKDHALFTEGLIPKRVLFSLRIYISEYCVK